MIWAKPSPASGQVAFGQHEAYGNIRVPGQQIVALQPGQGELLVGAGDDEEAVHIGRQGLIQMVGGWGWALTRSSRLRRGRISTTKSSAVDVADDQLVSDHRGLFEIGDQVHARLAGLTEGQDRRSL